MKKSGFTILEVMIAIFILTVGVGASYALIQRTLVASYLVQSNLIAYQLAQGGVEIVRNIRDSNWLRQRADFGVDWDNGISDDLGIGESRDYIADYTNTELDTFQNTNLMLGINGFYGYSGTTLSPFKRKINISKLEAGGIEVTIEVEWQERKRTHIIELKNYLYNWYGYE